MNHLHIMRTLVLDVLSPAQLEQRKRAAEGRRKPGTNILGRRGKGREGESTQGRRNSTTEGRRAGKFGHRGTTRRRTLDTVEQEASALPEGGGAAGVGNRREQERRVTMRPVDKAGKKDRRRQDRDGGLSDRREFTHGGGLSFVGRQGL